MLIWVGTRHGGDASSLLSLLISRSCLNQRFPEMYLKTGCLRCPISRWIRLSGWWLSAANDQFSEPEETALGLTKKASLQLQPLLLYFCPATCWSVASSPSSMHSDIWSLGHPPSRSHSGSSPVRCYSVWGFKLASTLRLIERLRTSPFKETTTGCTQYFPQMKSLCTTWYISWYERSQQKHNGAVCERSPGSNWMYSNGQSWYNLRNKIK